MTADTNTDLDRLRAWLDETERLALAARRETGRWSWTHSVGEMCNDPGCPGGALLDRSAPGLRTRDGYAGTVLMEVHGLDVHDPEWGAGHIAHNDPARVLGWVRAVRTILVHAESAQALAAEEQDSLILRGACNAYAVVIRELAAATPLTEPEEEEQR